MPAVRDDRSRQHVRRGEFYAEAATHGVKPIIGCEVYVAPKSRFEQGRRAIDDYEAGGNYHLILLAMNARATATSAGSSRAGYTEGFYYKPRIDKELLRELNGGLIALSGCLARRGRPQPDGRAATSARSPPARTLRRSSRTATTSRSRTTTCDKQERVNRRADRARRASSGLPLVATNDCHYLPARTPRRTRCCSASRPARRSPTSSAGSSAPTSSSSRAPTQMAQAFAHVPGGGRPTRSTSPTAATSSSSSALPVPGLPGAGRARPSRSCSSASPRAGSTSA